MVLRTYKSTQLLCVPHVEPSSTQYCSTCILIYVASVLPVELRRSVLGSGVQPD